MFYIEGNIGVGKTTFITLLNEYLQKNLPDSGIMPEPVDAWLNLKDDKGTNILQYYYENSKKYGFSFQINAFMTRLEAIETMKKQNKKYMIMERSVFTDKNVFTMINYLDHNINYMELKIYEESFRILTDKFDLQPKGFIYLKTTPQICHQRIQKRNREGENRIPYEYLDRLDALHDIWINDERNRGIPILEVDVSDDYIGDEGKKNTLFKQIVDFIVKNY